MTRRLKLLTGLSTLTVAGALALSACGGEGEGSEGGEGAEGATTPVLAGGEGETAEGEGEGGESEGEGASGKDPATDDVEYIHRLGQARGHLVAFITLHKMAAHDMAMTHAKHPESELYADLEPAFTARNKPGFADELPALADAVAQDGNVDAAYAAVTKAITANEPDVELGVYLLAIATITRTAGDEFKIGVSETGAVTNAHEYQDAFGFLTASLEMTEALSGTNDEERAAIETTKAQLKLALEEFGDLTADQTSGRSAPLYGAAARIELAALGLQ